MGVKKERLKYVDVLRVIAMISVFTVHYTRALESSGIGTGNKILPDFVFGAYLGSFGVAIFFILSGIYLMYTYNDMFELKSYIKKRFLGVYPMFWICYILVFLYYFYVRRGNTFTAPNWTIILSDLGMDGYLCNYGPNFYIIGEWFLGCLIFLYILFPILRFGVKRFPIITAVIILLIYGILPYHYTGTISMELFFLLRLPEFAFGMYMVNYKWDIKWYVALPAMVVLAAMQILDTSSIPVLYVVTAVGILSVISVYWICKFIKWEKFYSLCKLIGKNAYGVFLTHHVVLYEITRHFAGLYMFKMENYMLYAICWLVTGVATVLLSKLYKRVMKFIKEN